MNRYFSIKFAGATTLALLVLGALLWPLPGVAQGVSVLSIAGGDEPQPGQAGLQGDHPENPFPTGSPVRADESTHNGIIARTDAVLMDLGGSDVSIDVLANDVYELGDRQNLSVSEVTSPEHGEAERLANGVIGYAPDDGFFGRDSFYYTVTDGTLSSEGRVWVTVPDPNAPKWEVTWEESISEGESTDLRVRQANPNVTVDPDRWLGVTMHVGIHESTGDVDDIIVMDGCCDILPDHPFTPNIHHDGARTYIVGPMFKDAQQRAMTIEAIDDDDSDETLALWIYVDGYLAGVGTLTIEAQ